MRPRASEHGESYLTKATPRRWPSFSPERRRRNKVEPTLPPVVFQLFEGALLVRTEELQAEYGLPTGLNDGVGEERPGGTRGIGRCR